MASAFFTAASGIRNMQTKLDVIANNIANINTVGYKSSTILFGELLSQIIRGASAPTASLGGTNPIQVGLGSFIAAISTNFTQTGFERTERPTDVAINGRGFFVTRQGNQLFYTRAGNFGVDAQGQLVTPDGRFVQGFVDLTPDGQSIDPNSRIGDIIIRFGQKLEARATTQAIFASNLDASSDVFGSAELVSAGTTGIQTVSEAMRQRAVIVGTSPAVPGSVGQIVINGDATPTTYDTTPATNSLEAAQIIADAINSDPDINQAVQATVRNVNNQGFVVIQAIPVDGSFTIDGTGATGSGFDGLPLTTIDPAPEPDFRLVGRHELVITDAQAATVTTQTPVGFGANAPDPTSDFTINGVLYQLSGGPSGINFSDTGTAAGNAAIIANIINNTPGTQVKATANPNGTLTITQLKPGKNNTILIDFGVPPNTVGEQPPGSIGLASIPDDDPGTPFTRLISNGVNARAEVTFIPEDGSPPLVRFFEDDAPTGTASSLERVRQAITGPNPTFPLIPGVVISAEELKAGRAIIQTKDAFRHTTNRIVYDSLGNPHDLNVTFIHVKENTWDWVATLPKEPDLVLSNNTGRITFDNNGLISVPNPSDPITFEPSGADRVEINFVFDGEGEPIAGITQFSAPTTTAILEQDGFPMGVLQSFEIDQNGVISGLFDNGQVRPIAQLALADFNNPQGLQRSGNTSFIESDNSGVPIFLRPNTGGVGTIFGGFLEQSNVDLTSEFTQLITAQRGLQANSRVFTTQDQVLEEIVNLRR